MRELALQTSSRDDAIDDLSLGVYQLRLEALGKDGQRRAVPVSDDRYMPLCEEIELRWQSPGVCGYARPRGGGLPGW